MTATVEDLLSELAQAPPRAFTEARKALVAKATKLGQADAAARLKAVRRPTAAVWAVNQLARKERDSVGQLISIADRMRAAQLGRGAAASNLTEAIANHRAILAHLTQRAEAILREAGLGAPHHTLVRVETTLAGGAADPELQSSLRDGRLEHEVTARGFDVFAGEKLPPRQPVAATPRQPPASPARGISPPRATPVAKQERGRDEARLGELREAVSRAQARADQERVKAEEARKQVEQLTGQLSDARRRAAQLEREERRAADTLRAAREHLHSAETRASR